jgi:DNA-binding MarR family transcriptional regulator
MTRKPKPPPSPVGAAARETVEAAQRGSMGHLLFEAARLLDERALSRVNRDARARGLKQPTLRPAHTRLLPHIDFEGTRLTTIADRVGVTKQAVSQRIAELLEMKVVELVPDPDDARAKRVRFTARGAESIHYGLSVLRGIEEELAAKLGGKELDHLRRTLASIVAELERPDTR